MAELALALMGAAILVVMGQLARLVKGQEIGFRTVTETQSTGNDILREILKVETQRRDDFNEFRRAA